MNQPTTASTWLEREMLIRDAECVPVAEKNTPGGIDPDGLLAYLRETTQAALDPDSLAEGEFPERFLTNALEALTTFAALDAWLSGGGRPPYVWSRMWHLPPKAAPHPTRATPADPDPKTDPQPRKDPTP